MKHNTSIILVVVIFLILISSYAIFAQEVSGPATPAQEPAVTQTQPPAEPETQWVWGEVASVDPQKNEIVVKYLDYETDQEKEMALAVDDKTTYENIKSLADIKLKDALSVDYVVDSEGKNIAKNINVEKADEVSAVETDTRAGLVPETANPAEQEAPPENTTATEAAPAVGKAQ